MHHDLLLWLKMSFALMKEVFCFDKKRLLHVWKRSFALIKKACCIDEKGLLLRWNRSFAWVKNQTQLIETKTNIKFQSQNWTMRVKKKKKKKAEWVIMVSFMPMKMRWSKKLQPIASPNTYTYVFHFWLETTTLHSGRDGPIYAWKLSNWSRTNILKQLSLQWFCSVV